MLPRSLLYCLIALGCLLSEASGQVSHEYKLKAAFLFHFTQFVEWPTNSFAQTNSPLVIGVLGRDPFGPVLDELVRGERVEGHKLEVDDYWRVQHSPKCQVLFICRSEKRRLKRILKAVKNRPILTVSDIPGCARQGVMIGLVTENDKIRFRINLAPAKAAGLSLSSKLLRLAEVIPPEKKP